MSEKRIMVEAELVDLAEPWSELQRPVLRHRMSYNAAAVSLAWAPATLRLHPRYKEGPDPLRLPSDSPLVLKTLAGIAVAVVAIVLISSTL